MAETSRTTREKKKGKQVVRIKAAELDAYQMFMITDFFPRYYQTHPRSKSPLVPHDTLLKGQKEWTNLSDIEKAEWIEKFKDFQAQGKSLFRLRTEYQRLYPSA